MLVLRSDISGRRCHVEALAVVQPTTSNISIPCDLSTHLLAKVLKSRGYWQITREDAIYYISPYFLH
jgi:hypothetical protein